MNNSTKTVNAWKESLIRKASSRLLELDGVEILNEEAEVFVRSLLTAYDGILEDAKG